MNLDGSMCKDQSLKRYSTIGLGAKPPGRKILGLIPESDVTENGLCVSITKMSIQNLKLFLNMGGVFIKSFFENVNFLLNMGGYLLKGIY